MHLGRGSLGPQTAARTLLVLLAYLQCPPWLAEPHARLQLLLLYSSSAAGMFIACYQLTEQLMQPCKLLPRTVEVVQCAKSR
jgi:hypothetical protein